MQLKFGTTELTNLTDIFDPEAARATLEDAGYSWDDDGQLLMK